MIALTHKDTFIIKLRIYLQLFIHSYHKIRWMNTFLYINGNQSSKFNKWKKFKVLFSIPYNLFAAMLGSFPKLVFWKTWIQIMRKIGICAFLRISQQVVLDSVMFKFYILRWKSFQEMFNLPRSLTITKESFFSHYFNDFSFVPFLN